MPLAVLIPYLILEPNAIADLNTQRRHSPRLAYLYTLIVSIHGTLSHARTLS